MDNPGNSKVSVKVKEAALVQLLKLHLRQDNLGQKITVTCELTVPHPHSILSQCLEHSYLGATTIKKLES
jgi:hypothetical protein